jgi:RecA-family ATPase
VLTVVPRLREGPRHLIAPIAPHAETTVLYGPGGSGKGYLGLVLALAISCHATVPLVEAQECGPVLYLDWESTEEEFSDRAYQLAKGLGCRVDGALHYKQMHGPLTMELASVQAAVHQHRVICVFVDSLVPASGLEPESADAASRTFMALRTLSPATRIVIAHVTKAAAEGMTRSKPFGSIFIENLARSTWEVRASDEDPDTELVMALYHQKVNSGRRSRPLTFRFQYQDDVITVGVGEIKDQPTLVQRLGLKDQLRYALQRQQPQTVAELASTVGRSEASVREALNRSIDTFLRLTETQGRQPQLWSLRIR